VAVGVLGAVQQRPFKPSGAGIREAAAEDSDEILASEGLRHALPSLAGLGVAGEGGFHQGRRVEFGFHSFHQIFGGVLGATQARLFFFDFADFAVDLVARGVGQGVEKFLEAFGLRSSRVRAGWMEEGITDYCDSPEFVNKIDYIIPADYGGAIHSRNPCRKVRMNAWFCNPGSTFQAA
jgi:hypothetical protein